MPFRKYRGGRRPAHPLASKPRLWVDDFLTGVAAPVHHQTVDYFSSVSSWPMDLNDRLGTCGIAGMDHLQMAWNAYAQGASESWGDEKILQLYEQLAGYVPGDESTDQGTILQDNLDYWRKAGVNGEKILFFGALKPGSWLRPERVKALQAFGGLYLGHAWPESAEEQFDTGALTFDTHSPIAGGHCTVQHGELAGRNEVRIGCWAKVVAASTSFLLHTVEEAWVVGHADFIEVNGRNPSGLDLNAMNDALYQLTGKHNLLGLRKIL